MHIAIMQLKIICVDVYLCSICTPPPPPSHLHFALGTH